MVPAEDDWTPRERPVLRHDVVDCLRELAELAGQVERLCRATAMHVGKTGAWGQRPAQQIDMDVRVTVRRILTKLNELPNV